MPIKHKIDYEVFLFAEKAIKTMFILSTRNFTLGEIYPDLKVVDVDDDKVTYSIHNDQPKPLVYEFPISRWVKHRGKEFPIF